MKRNQHRSKNYQRVQPRFEQFELRTCMAVDFISLPEIFTPPNDQESNPVESSIVISLPVSDSMIGEESLENLQDDLIGNGEASKQVLEDGELDAGSELGQSGETIDLVPQSPEQELPEGQELPIDWDLPTELWDGEGLAIDDWNWLNDWIDNPPTDDPIAESDNSDEVDDSDAPGADGSINASGVDGDGQFVLGSDGQFVLDPSDAMNSERDGTDSKQEPNLGDDLDGWSVDGLDLSWSDAPNENQEVHVGGQTNPQTMQAPNGSSSMNQSPQAVGLQTSPALDRIANASTPLSSSPLASPVVAGNEFRRFSSLEMIAPSSIQAGGVQSSGEDAPNSSTPGQPRSASADAPRYFASKRSLPSIAAARPTFSGQQMAHFFDSSSSLGSPIIGHASVGLFSVDGNDSAKFEKIARNYFVPLNTPESSSCGASESNEVGAFAGRVSGSNWLSFVFGDAENVDSQNDQNRLILVGLLAFLLEKVRGRAKWEQEKKNCVTFIPKFNLRR